MEFKVRADSHHTARQDPVQYFLLYLNGNIHTCFASHDQGKRNKQYWTRRCLACALQCGVDHPQEYPIVANGLCLVFCD